MPELILLLFIITFYAALFLLCVVCSLAAAYALRFPHPWKSSLLSAACGLATLWMWPDGPDGAVATNQLALPLLVGCGCSLLLIRLLPASYTFLTRLAVSAGQRETTGNLEEDSAHRRL